MKWGTEGLKHLNNILGRRLSILTAFREQMRVVYFPATVPKAEVARFLEVTASSVNWVAVF